MRRSVIVLAVSAGLAALAFVATPARSADIYKAPRYETQQQFNWSGFYLGASAGYGWADETMNVAGTDPNGTACVATGACAPSFKTDSNGWMAGAQIGFNVHNGRVVYGIEADWSYADIGGDDGQTLSTAPLGLPVSLSGSGSSELNWLATIRARLGVTVTPTTLIYATGGMAAGDVSSAAAYTLTTPFPGIAGTAAGSASDVKWGWTVGGGIEQALSHNWSLKVEYLYVDLGSTDFAFGTTIAGAPFNFAASVDHTYHVARAGLNYRF